MGIVFRDGLEMGLTEADATALVEGMKIRPVYKFPNDV